MNSVFKPSALQCLAFALAPGVVALHCVGSTATVLLTGPDQSALGVPPVHGTHAPTDQKELIQLLLLEMEGYLGKLCLLISVKLY